jgi:hypothetical protein
LLLPNGLVQRQNNQLLAQTRDENRRPIFVVPNLHRDDCACTERVHFGVKSACMAFNVLQAPRDPAIRIKKRRVLAFA